jgi:DHA3 family macrolide efflux protein-like MFS transporter
MIEAFFTIGIIAGSLIIGKLGQKFKMSTLIVSGFAAVGVGVGLLSIIKLLGIAILVCFLIGAFIPLIDTSALTIIQQSTPKEKMGRVISTLRTMCLLGMPLGFAVSGFIAAGLKIEYTYLLVGILILLLCILPFFSKEFRKI